MAPEHEGEPAAAADSELGSEDRAGDLLRTASHDLRSPLAVIQLLARRAERRQQSGLPPSDGDWLATLSRIDRIASHALAIIDDLLSVQQLSPSQATPAVAGAAID